MSAWSDVRAPWSGKCGQKRSPVIALSHDVIVLAGTGWVAVLVC